MNPVPPVREVSTVSPAPPASVNQKGPDVYYPPGAEFTKSVQVDLYCHINCDFIVLIELSRNNNFMEKHKASLKRRPSNQLLFAGGPPCC